ncbi:LysM peptidoglycan-binding domain-containing protein [Peribacillus sp. NPDC076916]|uniref:LysM peptidoglycan-binding domain-containing protein n=1 Tax=Peribacillus sp. NPDC076916 TaxID=3390608 RepID=UPI003D065F77
MMNLNGSWLIIHPFTKELRIQKRDRKSAKHTIVKGDTVSALAKKYGRTIEQIKDLNALESKYTIKTGQKLFVK